MLEKLRSLEKRFCELENLLALPETASDAALYSAALRELGELEKPVSKFREYLECSKQLEELERLAADEDRELGSLAEEEAAGVRERARDLLAALRLELVPRDPDADNNVIVEIRSGAGGEEAALFVGVLYRMYSMFAASCSFRIEPVNSNETGLGGFKEVTFTVVGKGAFSKFKYESGVHRVQRIPETEASGRIHTSTVTVAVLPEVKDVSVTVNPADLEISAHRASGAGGQHVNKTDSAIRILHKPTGIVVECQDERSQFKNRDKAMKVLLSKLSQLEKSKQVGEIAEQRRSQVGTGDRSERIRTYNYPQGRVTDHRIGLTLYDLENILNGRLSPVVDALAAHEAEELVKNAF